MTKIYDAELAKRAFGPYVNSEGSDPPAHHQCLIITITMVYSESENRQERP